MQNNSEHINILEEMSNFTFVSKYAKYDDKKKRRETWEETVNRVEKMHLKKYNFLSEPDKNEIIKAFDLVREKKVSPSMRALEDNTPILTTDGWKTVGGIEIGDRLFDSNGKITNVLSIKKFKNRDLYKIIFSDNSSLTACNEHLWIVATTDDLKNNKTRVVNTLFLLKHLKQGNKNNISIKNPRPINFEKNINLKIDPYILGLWLGDGYSSGQAFAAKPGEDSDYMISAYEKRGYLISKAGEKNKYAWNISNIIKKDLSNYNLIKNKHIPEDFKFSSIENRIALLQGLMDTDGCCTSKGRCLFSNTNLLIIKDVRFILSSLGVKFTETFYKSTNLNEQDLYTISFFPNFNCFLMPRKRNILEKRLKNVKNKRTLYRKIISIKKITNGNASCFHVDSPDSSFLAGEKLIVTHNSMQFGGKAIEAHNAKIYNCAVRHIDSIRSFSESLYILLCGTGIGFGISDKYLNRLPDLVNSNDKTGTVLTYVISDSIEGWADSIEALLNCYFKNTAYSGRKIAFDYSKIRKEGELLKTGGGKAPGYKGLKNCHIKIKKLLDFIIEENSQIRLKTINAYDILMHCADAVLSGGVRRSACSVIFNIEDKDLLNAKTGNWIKDNPQRARSNNSVLIIRDKIDLEDFKKIVLINKEFGEPGFVFGDSEDQLLNPCQPKWAKLLTKEGWKELGDVNIGDEIWSIEGWTKIIKKWSTGIKKVYRYTLDNGCVFNGTKNHKIVQHGIKIEVDDAEFIDSFEEGERYNCWEKTDRKTKKTKPHKIISRQYISTEEVFDITVDNKSHTYWTNGCNVSNCFEISFIPITKDGICGYQFCNLTSINGSKINCLKDFENASWAASLIGTLQAGYTKLSYLTHVSEQLTNEERLLGVSITGMMDQPQILFNPENQKIAAKIAVETNEVWAKKININKAARVTCIKPEGTNSVILMSGSGIHPHHDRKYIRRIQCNKLDNVYRFFKKHNNHACEAGVWSENKTDDVISFPIKINENSMIKDDLNALEHLNLVKLTQENWVNFGTTDANKKPIHNSVSCTIIIKDNEWDKVSEYLFNNRKYFTAVSLIPDYGDKLYKQAPMEAIKTKEDEEKFESLVKNWKKINYSELLESEDETTHIQEVSCAGGSCQII